MSSYNDPPEPVRHARNDHTVEPLPDFMAVLPVCGWCATRGECDCTL
jgi:hypothetical protein